MAPHRSRVLLWFLVGASSLVAAACAAGLVLFLVRPGWAGPNAVRVWAALGAGFAVFSGGAGTALREIMQPTPKAG